MFPGYFALVMATGIIATAAKQQKIDWLAESLYPLTVGAYVVLVAVGVIRVLAFQKLLPTLLHI